MKTSNQKVCHEFAKGASADLSVYSGNISLLENDKKVYLYSYRTVIAIYDKQKDIFLISTRKYSVTTSSHQNYLNSALSGYNCIYMYDVNKKKKDSIKYFFDDIKEYAEKQVRARKADYSQAIEKTLENLGKFLEYLNFDKRSKEYKKFKKLDNSENIISDILELKESDYKEAIRAIKNREKAQKKKNLEDRKALLHFGWIDFLKNRQKAFENGKDFYIINSIYRNKCEDIKRLEIKALFSILHYKDILKLKNNHVITSQGVTISFDDFIKFYKLNEKGLLKSGDDIIGYKVRDIQKGFIEIGCHTMAMQDIKNIYQQIKKD